MPKQTVYENVAFPLQVTHHKKPYIHARALEVLHTVGMEGKKDKFPRELSGGERQKVALARALVNNPRLLIADEPTGNLDPKAAEELFNLLLKINANGTTVIVATHNYTLVDELKRRVVVLENGKVVSDEKEGTYPEDMRRKN